MTERPILLFDVMQTLVHDPFFVEVPAWLQSSFEEFLRDKHKEAWIEFEHGRIDVASYLRSFYRDGSAIDGEGLKACLSASYRWLDGMEQLLSDLHRLGYQMHALSNYSAWYQLIEERIHASRFLEWTFVSCKTGVRKPDPRAYLGAARALDAAPGDCLFVDDRETNCAAARAVGMQALVFRGADQLRSDLAARGLL